jgi:glycosyltransferase involved in cell wall biosynthesis
VNPDVVLISHLINHSPSYVSVAHRWHVPVVLELHDFYLACERAHLDRWTGGRCGGPEAGRACATYCFPNDDRAVERWALRTHMFRRALQQADALTCPSNFVADYFRELYGPLTPPLHVIGNGVDFDPPTPTSSPARDGPLHLACVGVVGPHKGTQLVLEALRLADLPRARLSLFGEAYPPYYRGLEGLADGLEKVDFRAYGTFEPVELPFLLEDVDVVVIPSLVWETYSIVAREAMACGISVIASRLGALPEAVRHGQNGLLFEPGSALDLATVLQMVDGDRNLLGMLRAGIRRSDWISVPERIARLQAVLDEVVSAGKADGEPPELDELLILRNGFLETSA